MALTAKVVEVVALPPGEFPRVAVNAMVSLQYRSEIFDEVDRRLVFYDDAVESYGMDTWRCRYQAILNWTEHEAGLELEVKLREKNYGDTHIDACVERAEKIVLEILRGAERSRGKAEPDVPWKAKFASKEELLDSGFVVEPAVLPEGGALLVGKLDDQRVWLSRDMKVRHVLVCGPTGCGKSTSIFIPNLIERLETSAIVTEASPGSRRPVLYGATAGWRAAHGHRVIYFNPDDMCTMRFNPVDLVRTFDDAQMIAGLIVSNTTPDSHMGDQIWSQVETHLLQALLLHAAGLRHDLYGWSTKGDGANLASIRRLLRTGPHGMGKELEGTRLSVARAEYEAFLNNSSPNFRFGVVSGLLARLAIFANPKVASATEVTDFSLEELSRELFTMYLAVPVHRPDFLPLAALAFNFIFTFVLSKLDELKHPLTLYLDEFTNYGAIPGIGRYLTVIRNAGVGAVLGVQDLAQLELVYKDKLAQILWSQPRTKILFPPADDRMAERISKMLGLGTDQEVVAASGNLSNRQFPRPLIEPSDLMRLEREGKYMVLSTTNPAKLDRVKSWQTYPSEISSPPPPVPPLVVEDLEEMSRKESYGGRAEKDGGNAPGADGAKEEASQAGSQPGFNVPEEDLVETNNGGKESLEDDDQVTGTRGDDEPEGDFWSQLRGKFG